MPEQQSDLVKFVKSLAFMRKADPNAFGFRILLEFDAPKH